jgi:hypothetical protein
MSGRNLSRERAEREMQQKTSKNDVSLVIVGGGMTEAAVVMLLEGEEWLQALAIVRKRRGQWDYLRWMKKGLRNMQRGN